MPIYIDFLFYWQWHQHIVIDYDWYVTDIWLIYDWYDMIDIRLMLMLMLMLMLWPLAVTPGVTHFGAYHRPPDGHFYQLVEIKYYLISLFQKIGYLNKMLFLHLVHGVVNPMYGEQKMGERPLTSLTEWMDIGPDLPPENHFIWTYYCHRCILVVVYL